MLTTVLIVLHVMVALAILATSVYRGRHWSRWAVVAFWILASFTGTVVGIGTSLSLGPRSSW